MINPENREATIPVHASHGSAVRKKYAMIGITTKAANAKLGTGSQFTKKILARIKKMNSQNSMPYPEKTKENAINVAKIKLIVTPTGINENCNMQAMANTSNPEKNFNIYLNDSKTQIY